MDWEEHWTPNLCIDNALGDVREESWHAIEHDSKGAAWVYEKRRVKGAFLEYLELNQFPFDTQVQSKHSSSEAICYVLLWRFNLNFLCFQDLTVTVSSERGEGEVQMEADTVEASSVNVQSFVAEQEWHLHETVNSWKKVTLFPTNSPPPFPSTPLAITTPPPPPFTD